MAETILKPTVYIETTIPSYLTAWPSRNLVRQAHQQVTFEWWQQRDKFELFVSQVVLSEVARGDPVAAAERTAALAGIAMLEIAPPVVELADLYRRELSDSFPCRSRRVASGV